VRHRVVHNVICAMYRGAAHLDSVAVAPTDTYPHVNVAIAPIATRHLLEIARHLNRESAIDAVLAREARGPFSWSSLIDRDRAHVRTRARGKGTRRTRKLTCEGEPRGVYAGYSGRAQPSGTRFSRSSSA